MIYSLCNIKVYSSLPEYTHKFINTTWNFIYAFISKFDKRQLHLSKTTQKKIYPGHPLFIRGFAQIDSEEKEYGLTKKRKNKKNTLERISGHQASRPEEIYFEGIFEYTGTSSKHLVITYNHKPDYKVYIPATQPLRGFMLPTACIRLPIIETVAFLKMKYQWQQAKIKPNTFSSQYSYDINKHAFPEPNNNDDDENKNDNDDNENKNDNDDNENKNDNDDIDHDIDDDNENNNINKPKPYGFEDDPKDTDDFCEKQNDRFFNKNFERSKGIRKKMQTAKKIIKISKTKALNSKKGNHKTPITFSTKVIFCQRVENGSTNKAAWLWMKQHGFQVGKSWENCHRWSQKGSGYWINKIAKYGNAEKFSFFCYLSIIAHTHTKNTFIIAHTHTKTEHVFKNIHHMLLLNKRC